MPADMTKGWLLLIVLLGVGLTCGEIIRAASENNEFARKLEKATELNVTAPWQESQELLDEIEPLLDQATPNQYATFQQLTIRNLALDGNVHEALELTDKLLDRDIPTHQRLNAFLRGANLAMLAHEYEEAFGYLDRALELEPAVDYSKMDADAFSVATEMLATVGELDRAIEYGHRSVERAIEHNVTRPECVARYRLAFAYREAGKLDAAKKQTRQAIEVCKQANDPIFMGLLEYSLGDILRRQEHYDEAEHQLREALASHEVNDYALGITETRLMLAQLHFEQGRHQPAEAILSKLVEPFEQNERWNLLARTHRLLAEIARQRGDYYRAVNHYEGRMTARERFLDRDRTMNLAYLEVAFDSQIKERELALLREQERARELEAEARRHQRRLQQIVYVITAFLIMVLALLLIHATRERRRYRRLSHRDGLTGLNNHTRFFEIAEEAFRHSRSQNEPFTMVLGDVDFFKQVNDQHGHLAGDEVLRRVAARLRDTFADHGIVGRIGGEEFAIALPGKTSSEIEEPLVELRNRLRNYRSDDEPIPVAMSFGVAQAADEKSFSELRERADKALYRAKKSGRDRAVFADAPA